MSQNIPFFVGAGGGPPPSALPSQQQQAANGTSSSSQPQPAASMAQYAAFQQNAQLSGLDLSVLKGITPDQIALIARLVQTGALPPPPELPPSASNAAPSVDQVPPPEPQAPSAVEPITQEQDMDVDRDEGEIEEFGADVVKEPRGFLHPPPTGPRSLNGKQRASPQNQRKSSPRPPIPTPPSDNSRALPPRQPPSPGMNGSTTDPAQGDKGMAAKAFVLFMLKNGSSFNDILKATGNPQALARMFTEMRLEIPPEISSTDQAQTNEKPPTNAPVKRPAPVKPPAPAKPLDRSVYLARLQAAKNKKAEPANPTAAVTKVADKNDAPPKPEVPATRAMPPNGEAKKVAPITADKNALLRQRLEALKAETAAKKSVPPQPTAGVLKSSPPTESIQSNTKDQTADASLDHSGLGAGLETVAVRASQMSSFEPSQILPTTLHQNQSTSPAQAILSPTPPTPTHASGGLPGLFMFGQSTQAQNPPRPQQSLESPATVQVPTNSIPHFHANRMPPVSQTLVRTPTASSAELNVPRKRPVASDFDYPTTKPKRPFGRSRGNSPADRVVIDISDDEDDDADDEMDTDNAAPPKSKLTTASFRDAAPLRDFPSRPTLHTQPSGQSTPGGSTPGGVTYEQRMKEIEEMKRKIAQAEKRKNANERTPVAEKTEASAIASRSDAPSPAVQTSSESTPKVEELPAAPVTTTTRDGAMPTTSPMAAVTSAVNIAAPRPMSARYQERERLRQRLVELGGDEFTNANVAQEAAADEPELVDDLSANNAGTAVQVASSPVVKETQLPAQPTESMNELEAEEGEISDDSLFNFYSPPAAEAVAADSPAPEDVRGVGSQVSTASEMSIDDQTPATDQSAFLDGSQPAPDLLESLQDTQLPYSVQQEDETIEPVPESLVPSPPVPGSQHEVENVDEVEDSDSSSQNSESSDDDSQDLDRSAAHLPAATTNTLDNEDLSNLDASADANDYEPSLSVPVESASDKNEESDGVDASADIDEYEPSLPVPVETISDRNDDSDGDNSSAEIDDYEPSLPVPLDATSELEDPANSTPSRAVKPGAGISEPAMVDNAADDELAPELQPSLEEHAVAKIQTPAKPHFKPYESALRGFKDYRWHPDFLQTSSQGYQSLTFNHKIDPNIQLCPFEGAGGQCNDPTCGFQHFKDMGLTDNELLKLLGMHSPPAHSPDDHKRWTEGLGSVIKKLRSANVGRDVNAIAAAITEYRREFVDDLTRVLNLG